MEHWTSKVKTFKDLTLEELEEELNKFSKENFVYATNVFPYEYKTGSVQEPETIRAYDLIIFFKEPPIEPLSNREFNKLDFKNIGEIGKCEMCHKEHKLIITRFKDGTDKKLCNYCIGKLRE